MTTGRELAAFWTRCEVGTRLTCVENTYWTAQTVIHPELAAQSPVGRTFTVTRVTRAHLDIADHVPGGNRLTKPQRVSDVVSLGGDTIVYRLFADSPVPRHAGHTATWRIEK